MALPLFKPREGFDLLPCVALPVTVKSLSGGKWFG